MTVEQSVRQLHVWWVPAVALAPLVTADEQNRMLMLVEREQHADAGVRRPQLLHPVVPRALDVVDQVPTECGAFAAEDVERLRDPIAVCRREPLQPVADSARDEDLPFALCGHIYESLGGAEIHPPRIYKRCDRSLGALDRPYRAMKRSK
jgi:hypothetical protein